MTGFLRRSDGGKSRMRPTWVEVIFLVWITLMAPALYGCERSGPSDQDLGNVKANGPTCRIVLRQAADGETVVRVDRRTIGNDQQGDYERTYLPGRFGFDEQELEEHLRDRSATYVGRSPRGLKVIIDFAKDVPYKYVVQVLNSCRGAEIGDIGFAMPEIPLDGN